MKKVLHTWTSGENVCVRYDDRTVESIKVDWYFVVDVGDEKKVVDLTLTIDTTISIEKDSTGNYLKIYVPAKDLRSKVVLLFEEVGIQTYEGDLLLDKRWYVDQQIEVGTHFKKLYFDIETDDSSPMINIGGDRVLSFAGVDDQGKQFFDIIESETDEAEEKLLKKFLRMIKDYDLTIGWNSSEFDIPYLRLRMERYGMHKNPGYCWREVGKYDLLKRFRHIFRFDSHIKSFALDAISKHFLGRGKIPHVEKIIGLYRERKDLLRDYNLEDCILVKELDEKLGVSSMMIRQSQWCGVPPAKFGLYSVIDTHILKKAHGIGKYCRTSINAIKERNFDNQPGNMNPNETDTEKSKYIGALVLDPVIGKYDNVYTFDFKGLYPSMMRTSNIGYDTLRYEGGMNRLINPGTQSIERMSKKIVPTYFEKDPSVINIAITELITKRSEYKDLKLKMIEEGKNKGRDWEKVVSDEIIVKELANSTYGIMGLEYGRYYSVDVAESITLFGQWCILYAKRYFESLGYEVIYGDTDSVFVNTKTETLDIDKALEGFHMSLRRDLKTDFNIDESFIQLNFDKHYDTFLLIAKKTYVGHVISMEGKKTDEIYARGLEFHKKNTFTYAAKKQKELIEYMLFKNPTEKDLVSWASTCRREYYDREFSKEELVITQRVGKSADDYAKTPPLHVRLAQKIFAHTGVDMHRSEIEYIVTGNDGKIQGVLAVDYSGKFDRDFYWENKTLPILGRITDVLYPGDRIFGNNLTLF